MARFSLHFYAACKKHSYLLSKFMAIFLQVCCDFFCNFMAIFLQSGSASLLLMTSNVVSFYSHKFEALRKKVSLKKCRKMSVANRCGEWLLCKSEKQKVSQKLFTYLKHGHLEVVLELQNNSHYNVIRMILSHLMTLTSWHYKTYYTLSIPAWQDLWTHS